MWTCWAFLYISLGLFHSLLREHRSQEKQGHSLREKELRASASSMITCGAYSWAHIRTMELVETPDSWTPSLRLGIWVSNNLQLLALMHVGVG